MIRRFTSAPKPAVREAVFMAPLVAASTRSP
jgi:hypothetical protein